MKKRVLITGATGFIGTALTKRLLSQGHRVHALVHDGSGWGPDIDCYDIWGRLESIDDCRRAIAESNPDVVFHLGAQAYVERAQRDPLTTFETNVRGTWNLLLAADRLRNSPRFIVATSDKAYGEMKINHAATAIGIGEFRKSYQEEDPLDGEGIYDASKSCADLVCRAISNEFGTHILVARMGNVYGPGDHDRSRIVPSIVDDIVHLRNPEIRSDGSPVRDYLYIEDAVDAYVALMEADYDLTGDFRAYNFAGGTPFSVLELTELAIEVALSKEKPIKCAHRVLGDRILGLHGIELKPIVLRERMGEISQQILNCERARKELNWHPTIPLKEGLRRTISDAWAARFAGR